NITHLFFGDNFNWPINNILPKKLTHLRLGRKYNHPLDGCTLPNITHLVVGNNFNQSINTLPDSVQVLIFEKNIMHKKYSKKINNNVSILYFNLLYYLYILLIFNNKKNDNR